MIAKFKVTRNILVHTWFFHPGGYIEIPDVVNVVVNSRSIRIYLVGFNFVLPLDSVKSFSIRK